MLFCGEVRYNHMTQPPARPLLDMPTARNLLLSSGVADACAEALKRSIDNWGQTPPILRVADDDGAARGMGIYKLWNHHVRNLLLNCQTVDFYKKPCPFFGVDRLLGVRVKHVDEQYQSQMNDTRQAQELKAQLPLKGFYGPHLTQLECGYRLDLTGTMVEKAAFICGKDRKILWLWQFGVCRIPILGKYCPAGIWQRPFQRCMPTTTFPDRTRKRDFMAERDTLNPEALGLGRKSRGMTQGKLAALIGVSAARWSRIESGITALRVEDSCVERICEALDYPVQFFQGMWIPEPGQGWGISQEAGQCPAGQAG